MLKFPQTRSSRDLTRVEGAAAITIEYLTVNPGASMMSPNSTEILAHWNRSCLLVNNRAPIDLREEPCLNESMCFVVRKIKIAMQFVGEFDNREGFFFRFLFLAVDYNSV